MLFPKATGKGGYYYNDNNYDVRGGRSFKGKGYDDYYDGQGCRSFGGGMVQANVGQKLLKRNKLRILIDVQS
jgi:hypothetical protein